MANRRKFIETAVTGLAGISLLPAIQTFAQKTPYKRSIASKFKLRFALASNGHYAQPDTDSDGFYSNLIK